MKIVVYDVAAENGGGLFVLENFYNDGITKSPPDIKWYFMTSLDKFKSQKNVKVLQYPKVKQSWLHRLSFENFELPKIIKKISPNLIISLQNMPIMHCNIRQFVYLHQSLQYCPKRYSFFKSDERNTAIRQHIICGLFYKRTLPKADRIFVQTQWIKDATVKWINYPKNKINVVPVGINIENVPVREYNGQQSNTFFYPARAEKYKNHEVIIDACKQLVAQGICRFEVVFTISPNENQYTSELVRKAKGLPIRFIGHLDYDSIWEYYSKTILLFPSYLETCGLPMLEAKVAKGRIIASDMAFSHEALDGYENACFFRFDSSSELAAQIKSALTEKTYQDVSPQVNKNTVGLMESMLRGIT